VSFHCNGRLSALTDGRLPALTASRHSVAPLSELGQRRDDHLVAVGDELRLAAAAHEVELRRRRLRVPLEDAVGLHREEVTEVDGEQRGARRARARRDERLLREDVLGEELAQEVDGHDTQDDAEQRVEVQRPERRLAEEDETAGEARQVEQPRLALVRAHVHLAHARVHPAGRAVVQRDRRAGLLQLQAQRVVLTFSSTSDHQGHLDSFLITNLIVFLFISLFSLLKFLNNNWGCQVVLSHEVLKGCHVVLKIKIMEYLSFLVFGVITEVSVESDWVPFFVH